MAWLREIGLEFVDNEPALTTLIETLRAMKSGSRMIVENSPEVERDRRAIKTIRSSFEEKWEVKVDVTHCVWPWIAAQARFLFTRFEVGRDGKTAHERLKENSAKVQGLSFAEVILETGRSPAWKVDVYVVRWRVFGHQSNREKRFKRRVD